MKLFFLALLLVLATFPFEGLTVMGLPLARTAGLFFTFAYLLKILLPSSGGFRANRNHLVVLVALSILIISSAVRSYNVDEALVVVISLIANFLFFVIFCSLIKSPKELSLSFLVLAFSFLMSTIISLNIDLELVQISDELNDDLRFGDIRQAGFLRNANRYGYFALIIFWCGAISYALELVPKKLSLAIMIIGFITVFMSMSRAVILGLLLGLTYLLMLWNVKRSLITICVGFVVILTSTMFLSASQEENVATNLLLNRFQPDVLLNSGSTSARTSIWQETLSRIDENPILGVPLGSLTDVIGESGYKTHEPHNSFLYMLQYFGLGGLLVISGYFFWLLSILWSVKLNKNVKLLLLTFSLSMIIPNIFHTTLTWKPTLLMFCFIISILKFYRVQTPPISKLEFKK